MRSVGRTYQEDDIHSHKNLRTPNKRRTERTVNGSTSGAFFRGALDRPLSPSVFLPSSDEFAKLLSDVERRLEGRRLVGLALTHGDWRGGRREGGAGGRAAVGATTRKTKKSATGRCRVRRESAERGSWWPMMLRRGSEVDVFLEGHSRASLVEHGTSARSANEPADLVEVDGRPRWHPFEIAEAVGRSRDSNAGDRWQR